MKCAVFSKRAIGVVAVVCLAAGCALAGDTVVQEIIARINNQIITLSEFQRQREQMMNDVKQHGGSPTDPAVQEAEKNVLRDLIDQQLLIQKGQDLGISAETETVKKLDELRKQMHLDTMEELEKAAQQQGVSFEEYKQTVKNQIITEQVIQREVGAKVQITQEEEKQFYEQHKGELEQPETVRLSEILIAPAAEKGQQPTPEAIAAAEAKAQQALAEIKGGAKFEDVAKKYSNGPTAPDGGDLGMFKRGMLAKELEDKTFSLKEGETTDIIRAKEGMLILKVAEHHAAGLPTLKQVEPQIQQAIYMTKLQPTLREYLTKLREDAFIYVKPGFVDTGASPNQTQPVVTAANTPGAAPADKAKKKKKFVVF